MSKTGGTAESEFEGLLQKKATENHEMVSVPVLRLHDTRSRQPGLIHKEDVVGLSKRVVRIVVAQLSLPKSMYQIRLLIVGRLFEKRAILQFLSVCAVGLSPVV